MKQALLLAISLVFLFGQVEPPTDLRQVKPCVFVLKNATVHIEPGRSIPGASIAIRDGFIEAVGARIDIPPDATVLDMDDAHIYAGFMDAWFPVESTEPQVGHRSHWIDLVHPEWLASDSYTPAKKDLDALRKNGFTHVHAIPDTGIFRGQSAIMELDDTGSITVPSLAQVMDFHFRGRGEKGYPGALLGTIAVMRQTLYDADWYGQAQSIYAKHPDKNEAPKDNIALEVLGQARSSKAPFLFKTDHETSAQRAMAISKEFDLKLWLMGSGFEYRRLGEIAAAKPFVILPLSFPDKPNVSDPYQAAQVTLSELKHWDMAPDNPARLAAADLDIALTTAGLKDAGQFRKNLSAAVRRGFSESAALAALTTTPARHFGLTQTHGKIASGYQANLVVVAGNYFKEDAPVRSVWIRGTKVDIEARPEMLLTGNWDLSCGDIQAKMTVTGKTGHLRGNLKLDTTRVKMAYLKLDGSQLSWSSDLGPAQATGITRFRGSMNQGTLSGIAIFADGSSQNWTAENHTPAPAVATSTKTGASPLKPVYPEGAFGYENTPDQPALLLIQDATIWTSGPQGILEEYDILIEKGRIKRLGKDMTVPKGAVKVINARGKHITAGLIDSHSHTAAASINEGSQSITAEVRIKDVLDPDDINIYRQLAGGITAIHTLHGSANSIGGQNAILKLRWGADAHGLIMEQAPETIKFALGENVKQSNWGDDNVTRYPQTRMGVEQVLRDAFTRAQDYMHNQEVHGRGSKWRKTLIPVRKDLELDALVEVLEGKRRVHAHSYRQDEILMITRVADDFGVTLASLEHVLEGYKVAERLAEHGVAASTFTDWWAYKFEVYDAIPYNAILMQKAGVLVTFKSDSDELARRMNLEAAKGIKYGGMTETEALNMVTINPARVLKIDNWVGSLEPGKDGDLVIWSGHPLSTQSICEQTWIEGRLYFSVAQNQELLERDEGIRQEIIQRILKETDEKKPDGDAQAMGAYQEGGAK